MISFKKYLNEKRYSTYDSIDLGEGPDGIVQRRRSLVSLQILCVRYTIVVLLLGKLDTDQALHRNNGEWRELTRSL